MREKPVSWLGSSLQHFSGGVWWTSYLWLPVQFTLALAAFGPGRWTLAAVSCGALAASSTLLSAPGPDVLLTVVGSAAVLLVARGPLRTPAVIYFGAGSVLYLLMIQRIGGDIMPAWYAYQGARALAFVAFAMVLILPQRRSAWANG